MIGYFPYIRDIVRGIVKPHRITWFIWAILTVITAANQILNKGGWSSMFFISTAVLVFVTFLLSIKHGMPGFSTIDKICLVLALALLIYWATVQETRISTLLAVIIDTLGTIPTLIKTYQKPKTETYPQWVLAAIGGLLTIMAVPKPEWVLIIYPAYIFSMNSVIVLTKYYREK